ncbi:MAG: TPR Domain containing protein [Parcubacteria group bacterium Athens1014_10]|nr:MAG: TPR Domain containing protein [Parcubacteria group bacterium Athens1014_10]TSD05570.1 MAG: TPR Domain containing protein [Parcubacteria group bacterium Athens0714_12]
MPQEKLTKILVNIIKIGVLIILFLPLVISANFFFPFVVLRNFLFRTIAEIIFVLYLILAVYNPAYRPKFKNKIVLAVIIFFIVLFLACLFGADFKNSIWGNYERMNGLFHSLHLVLYFFVLVNVFKNKKDWQDFFTFSIFTSLLMSFICLAQYFQVPFLMKSSGGDRLTGTLGNATYLAAYYIFHLFLIYYFFAKEKLFSLKFFIYSVLTFDLILIINEIYLRLSVKSPGIITQVFQYSKLFIPFLILQIFIFSFFFFKSRQKLLLKIFLASLFIFEFFIFFGAQTRGAVLGLLAGILFYIFFVVYSGQKKQKIFASSFLILIIVFSLFIYSNKDSKWLGEKAPVLLRLTTISPKSITGESRLLTWEASWKGWLERPLLGYGLENYNVVFNKYFPAAIFRDQGSQIWFDKAHNIIFDIGATSGFIGLFSYLAIFIFAFFYLKKVYRKNKDFNESVLFGSLLIAYFGQNFFVFDTLNTEILFYLILGFIVFQSESNNAPIDISEQEKLKKEANFDFLTPAILLILFLFSFYNFNYKPLKGNYYLAKALLLKTIKEQKGESAYDEEVINNFKKALTYSKNTFGRFETRQQLTNYTMDLSRDESIDQNKLKELIEFAVNEMEKSVKESPLNVREHLYLATLYDAAAKFNFDYLNKSINVLTKAIPLSPTRPQLYFERGQAKIFQGKFEEAISDFKKGADLSPTVVESHWNLAAAYILSGQEDKAEEEFKKAEELGFNFQTVQNYQRLIQVYINKGDYAKMAELYKKMIELEPNVASHYAKLAWVYMQMGEKEKAKEATEKAVEIDPSLRAQADLFLEELKKK